MICKRILSWMIFFGSLQATFLPKEVDFSQAFVDVFVSFDQDQLFSDQEVYWIASDLINFYLFAQLLDKIYAHFFEVGANAFHPSAALIKKLADFRMDIFLVGLNFYKHPTKIIPGEFCNFIARACDAARGLSHVVDQASFCEINNSLVGLERFFIPDAKRKNSWSIDAKIAFDDLFKVVWIIDFIIVRELIAVFLDPLLSGGDTFLKESKCVCDIMNDLNIDQILMADVSQLKQIVALKKVQNWTKSLLEEMTTFLEFGILIKLNDFGAKENVLGLTLLYHWITKIHQAESFCLRTDLEPISKMIMRRSCSIESSGDFWLNEPSTPPTSTGKAMSFISSCCRCLLNKFCIVQQPISPGSQINVEQNFTKI